MPPLELKRDERRPDQALEIGRQPRCVSINQKNDPAEFALKNDSARDRAGSEWSFQNAPKIVDFSCPKTSRVASRIYMLRASPHHKP
jgi:hypothetical protein